MANQRRRRSGFKAVKQRAGHTHLSPKLAGEKERFVRRAISFGIRNIGQLEKFTSLPKERRIQLEEDVEFSHRIQGKPLPHNAVERLVISGELSVREISELTGKTPVQVNKARQRLAKRGIETSVTLTTHMPPLKTARTLIAYHVFIELGGLSPRESRIRASAIDNIEPETIRYWFKRHPDYLEKAKKLSGGRYWNKALKQMEPWIKSKEKEFDNGKKFKP